MPRNASTQANQTRYGQLRTARVVDPGEGGGYWYGPSSCKRPLMEVLVSSQGIYANYSANQHLVMVLLPRVPELLSGP